MGILNNIQKTRQTVFVLGRCSMFAKNQHVATPVPAKSIQAAGKREVYKSGTMFGLSADALKGQASTEGQKGLSIADMVNQFSGNS